MRFKMEISIIDNYKVLLCNSGDTIILVSCTQNGGNKTEVSFTLNDNYMVSYGKGA